MSDTPTPSATKGWLTFAIIAVGVFILGLLSASVLERRQESIRATAVTPMPEWETDNAEWGKVYPRQFASYKEGEDSTTRTRHGGAFPRDYLEDMPQLVVLFAGYGFSKDYLQARGHNNARNDAWETGRLKHADGSHKEKAPATCWTCKSPDVPRLMHEMGVKEFYASRFVDIADEIKHPIGCLDCHDPDTMALRISRPALVEAYERQGKDITKVSHQEMRSLVCAQCHVEYYFKGDGKYLTLPWDGGTSVEDMESYYKERDFGDWTHAISGAHMVKMQHPDYEVYQRGIHAYRNVSCADCHMPYRTEGGIKYTDHHVQSPLLNISNSCAVCHRWSEDEIRGRVETIQDTVARGRLIAEEALCLAHFDIAACKQAGATEAELKLLFDQVIAAQLRWDYVAANNGMGFHAPQECQRILQDATNLAQDCRRACAQVLAKHGYTDDVAYPDYSSKERAQALIGLFAKGEGPSLLAGR
ncbi:MAG: ammonia-forming cytochrome c nitrite reductase subunit c552 [Planctomycetota bacterium]|jgi:nitrite reductase (cytochrome c-552)|nr:ammonia-forming cytochrome c nitrite reductase subunit c552 [Planctomycetota bacterium]